MSQCYWADGCETGKDFWILYGEKGAVGGKAIGLLTKTDRESLNRIIDALNTYTPTPEQEGR